MVVIKNFTLVALPKPVADDPVAKRRAKLLEQLEQQKQLAANPSFVVVEHKWRRAEDGSKQLVERHKRVKRWWLINGAGQVFVTVRYGAKLIELEKGKAAISVSGKDKLAEVFEALIEAVRKGELDEQIKAVQSAAKASRKAA
jgi:myosin heavy subunit